jgi:L-erythro-3,5-diaminohexanoate dehydrogenase
VSAAAADSYGVHRVLGPQRVLPQQADRLDAALACQPTEVEVDVRQLHIDATSLRQLRAAHSGDLEAVRNDLLALVARRGKLHNPVTNSGGMLTGVVRAVGDAYQAPPPRGARIASLASLSLTPLRLDELGAIDLRSNSVPARGTAFLFQQSPWTTMPEDIPESVALAAFDVAGAPARVHARTAPGSRVLIVGAGNSGSLAAVAAVTAGAAEVVVADIDDLRLRALEALGLRLIHPVCADATDAIAFADAIGAPADLTACCVDVPGAEPACLLATRTNGHILFFSMATDFARAALCAEGVGSAATLEIGNGFYPRHAEFVVALLRAHRALWPLLSPAAEVAKGTAWPPA